MLMLSIIADNTISFFMRTITVDIKGLSFSFKMLLVFGTIVGAWFSWMPLQHIFETANEVKANVASVVAIDGDADFDNSVIKEDGKYIDIDITKKTISLYNNGKVFESFKILSVPRAVSPDSVLGGSYSIDEKVSSKLSTITMTRFPNFIKFGDKYAMHGEPIFSEERSDNDLQDGFIKLSNWSAGRVYDFAGVGMSVYVHAKDVIENSEKASEEKKIKHEMLPATSAEAYALSDVESGQMYLVKNGDNKYPIASITKLVTSAVATDVIGIDKNVMAPNAEYYKLGDLFYPLLLRSDNAVAKRMATQVGYGYFISNMNAYVKSVGMTQTSFKDASGLSPKNVSTALDLAKLAKHLHDKKSFILDITNESDMTITSTNGAKWNMTNQNRLAGDPHFKGGKLGYTDEAEQTAVSLFSVPLGDETRLVSVVILRSKDWKQDTRTLLRWLVENTDK